MLLKYIYCCYFSLDLFFLQPANLLNLLKESEFYSAPAEDKLKVSKQLNGFENLSQVW